MKLADTNVLIYAVSQQDPHHRSSRRWIEQTINSGETLLLPWLVVIGFVRLVTRAGILSIPLATDQAVQVARDWLANDNVLAPEPGAGHLVRVAGLLDTAGIAGNLVSDAHVAAIALEHDATVVSYDSDFGRFPGVRWQRPG